MNGYFKPSGSLLRHWVLEKDTSVLHSLCFFGTPFWAVSIPPQLCCTSWGSQAIGNLWRSRPSSLHWTFFDPLILAGWAFSLFPLFHGPYGLSFHGFWASNLLGLPSFSLMVSSTLLSLSSMGLAHCAIYLGLGVMIF